MNELDVSIYHAPTFKADLSIEGFGTKCTFEIGLGEFTNFVRRLIDSGEFDEDIAKYVKERAEYYFETHSEVTHDDLARFRDFLSEVME